MTLNINSKSISNVSNPFSDQNQKDKDFENLWKSFKIITSKSAFEIVYVWHNEDSKYQFKIHFKYFKSILRSKSKVHLKLCMLGTLEWMMGTSGASWLGGWGRPCPLSPRQLSLHVLAAIRTCRLYFLFKSF